MKIKEILRCAICGTEFEKTTHNKRLCSYKCQLEDARLRMMHRRRHRNPYDLTKYPKSGYVTCLKCEREFASWDKSHNRICSDCQDTNVGLGSAFEHRGYNKPNRGAYFNNVG